jgi:hypothetical protein
MLSTLLAFSWDPEFRGILFVSLMVVTTIGGSYVILSTNVGLRLGALITLTSIFGWCVVMGVVWWVFGIGLTGATPTWVPKDTFISATTASNYEFARDTNANGWRKLDSEDPSYGQAVASGQAGLLNDTEIFESSDQFVTGDVFQKGGDRYPKFGAFDLIAFFHEPNWSMVELKPVIPQNTEPGKAPPRPVIDESKDSVFILMERDLGYRRLPGAAFTIGSLSLLLVFASMLHKRDKLSMARTGKLPALTAGA